MYVDQSETAVQFFGDEKPILEFVNRNKIYRQSVYMRFIRHDYRTPLPLKDGSFDLLLALFAGGISKSCARYLKAGGILVTNNHQGDARDALQIKGLILEAAVQSRKGRYSIVEEIPGKSRITTQSWNVQYLKMAGQGIEYVENETYYIFRRSTYNNHRL